MLNRFKLTLIYSLTCFLLCALTPHLNAFSLLGNLAAYQTQALGYNRAYGTADLGGPMILGEEYRWNVPTLVYAFDDSFYQYFGTKGIQEVGKAFQILNTLPAASKMSAGLTEFPLDTSRENYRASASRLYDLKSFTLSQVVQALGLIAPERFTWSLYQKNIVGNPPTTNYYVISRNYDPVTLLQTNAVNGAHYGYVIHDYPPPTAPPYTDADEYQKADPAVVGFNSVAGFDLYQGTGIFLTGLTRDDVGGLRYLYSPKNYNVEGINTNTTFLQTGSTGTTGTGTGTGTGSPVNTLTTSFKPTDSVFGFLLAFTNIVSTNVVGAVTNVVGGVTNVVIGGVTNFIGTNLAVNIALRPGVDKITFVAGRFDSLLGVTFTRIINTFTDRFVANSVSSSQVVRRTIGFPDFIFGSADLGLNQNAPALIEHGETLTSFAANNTFLNLTTPKPGPGVIFGPFQLIFSSVLPLYFNSDTAGITQNDDTSAISFFRWGSFDGTDAEPTVYPQGASILDVEQQVLTP